MTLVGRHNIAKMTSLTIGTGTLTLSVASSGFNTFANAGVVDAEIVTYTIRDGANTEVGIGTYTSAGTTLSRTTVLSSTNAGSKISCSGRQSVMVSLAAEDIQPFANFYGTSGNVTNLTDLATIDLSTEYIDQAGIASIVSDEVIVARKGWYLVSVSVFLSSATAFNGYVNVDFGGYFRNPGYTTAQGVLTDMLYIGPFIYNAPTDSSNFGPVKISNHLGSTISTSVYDLTIFRIGNQ